MDQRLNLGNEVRELKLGSTFNTPKPRTSFHTLKYDFKPASVDLSKTATLDVSSNNQVTVTMPHLDSSGVPKTVFKGNRSNYTKECVLIIDKVTGEITLEKLHHNIQVKKTRSETNHKSSSNFASSHKNSVENANTHSNVNAHSHANLSAASNQMAQSGHSATTTTQYNSNNSSSLQNNLYERNIPRQSSSHHHLPKDDTNEIGVILSSSDSSDSSDSDSNSNSNSSDSDSNSNSDDDEVMPPIANHIKPNVVANNGTASQLYEDLHLSSNSSDSDD